MSRSRRRVSSDEESPFDQQIRSYLRAEYAKEAPPSHVFPRLMHAVKAHREEEQRRAEASLKEKLTHAIGQVGRALTAVYYMFGRGDTSRIISSGMVTALILLAMWPSMKQMLANDYLAPNLHSKISAEGHEPTHSSEPIITPLVSTDLGNITSRSVDEQRNRLLEQRIDQASKATPAAEDPNYLHPIERGQGNKRAIPLRTNPGDERPILGQE